MPAVHDLASVIAATRPPGHTTRPLHAIAELSQAVPTTSAGPAFPRKNLKALIVAFSRRRAVHAEGGDDDAHAPRVQVAGDREGREGIAPEAVHFPGD